MPGADFDGAPDALELTRFSVWVNGEVNSGALPTVLRCYSDF